MKKVLVVLFIVLMFSSILFGKGSINLSSARPDKVMMTDDFWMDVNRMNGVFRNNGIWLFDVIANDWGLEWPKGSGLSPVYAGGQYICAKVNGEVRVAGVQHSATEYQAGAVLSPGVAGNPRDGAYKWYELRPGGQGDWANWPVDQGAPLDAEGNPLLIGDVTAFSVWNDLGDHAEYGSNKLSVEVRQLVFAFNRADAMGDMLFIKWQIVNKSDADWDSTYLSLWLDPDLGQATDDFVGCDTTLGLGYCYNADNDDQNYGPAPPAMGMDFFQGPIIDEEGSIVTLPDGTVLTDKKMLKMTSYVYYNNNSTAQGNPFSAGDVWNYMRGYWKDATPITEGGNGTDPTQPKTTFMFAGDPESASGWLDSNADDRRFLMTTGPFDMVKWEDTNGNGRVDFGEPGVQEIVAGVIVARGSTNLNSVTVLKEVDNLAQLAYDLNFKLAKAPRQTTLGYSEMANEVVLTWTEDPEFNEDGSPYESADPIVAKAYGDTVTINNVVTEISDSTYNFYGYTVFQYSDAAGKDPVAIGHWDNGGQADAVPYSGPAHLRITQNKHTGVGVVGDPLINGKEYYFGVVPHGYLEFGAPTVFDGPAAIVTVVPQEWAGESYSASYQDTIEVTQAKIDTLKPAGDGSAVVWVADRRSLTGHDYKIEFGEDEEGSIVWHLKDLTTNQYVARNQTNQTGDDAYRVMDGLVVKVIGPPPGIKSISELDPATGEVSDANVWGSLNNYGRSQEWPVIVLHETGEAALDFTRVDRFGLMTPKDYDIIFTDDDSSLAFDYYTDTVVKDTLTGQPTFLPFTLWRIDLDGTRTRLAVCILDDNEDGKWGRTYHNPFTETDASFEPLYVYDNAEYNPAEVQTYIDTDDGTTAPGYGPWGPTYPAINRLCIGMYVDLDGYSTPDQLDADGVFLGPPHAGEYIRITSNKPNTTNDYFTFTAPDMKTVTNASIKADINKILVVPNPYYGYHSGEMDPYNRWVQFTHLPEKCTIRIFDLAGNLVRKLEKDDDSSLMQWDLENEFELPVASGIYVYHVDIPNVGEKIGKIAIFAPNERLDTY